MVLVTTTTKTKADLTETQKSLCRWVGHPSTPHSTRSRQPSAGAPRHLQYLAHRCRADPHTAALAPAATLPIAEGPAGAKAVREGRQLVFLTERLKHCVELLGCQL